MISDAKIPIGEIALGNPSNEAMLTAVLSHDSHFRIAPKVAEPPRQRLKNRESDESDRDRQN
jgi:hypothetical protein